MNKHTLSEQLADLVRRVKYEAMLEAARIADKAVCDTHLPTGIKIYGNQAGNEIRKQAREIYGPKE